MKIAIINVYQNKVERGAEVFVDEISKRLSRSNDLSVIATKRGITHSRSKFFWRFYLDAQSIQIAFYTISILPKLWRDKYDIIMPLNGGWQPALIRIFTWVRGGKMVISGQSGIGWDDRNNLWSFPNVFVALTPYAKEWAKRANPFINVKQIPNGVDINKFKSEKKAHKLPLKHPIILCVAALVPSKNVDKTIKAVAKLPGTSLLVVGKGPMEKQLKKMGKELLGNRFKIISASHSDMPSIYKSADLFTLCSESTEAFGIVYAEALASNLPVIATKDKQREYIVGNAGKLVNPNNTKEYGKVIKEALRTKWGSKPQKQAQKFDWGNIAKEYEKVFNSLVR